MKRYVSANLDPELNGTKYYYVTTKPDVLQSLDYGYATQGVGGGAVYRDDVYPRDELRYAKANAGYFYVAIEEDGQVVAEEWYTPVEGMQRREHEARYNRVMQKRNQRGDQV